MMLSGVCRLSSSVALHDRPVTLRPIMALRLVVFSYIQISKYKFCLFSASQCILCVLLFL